MAEGFLRLMARERFEVPCGEACQKRVGHGRMGLDLVSELPGKLAGSHGRGTR
jgi:hypothetical protein